MSSHTDPPSFKTMGGTSPNSLPASPMFYTLASSNMIGLSACIQHNEETSCSLTTTNSLISMSSGSRMRVPVGPGQETVRSEGEVQAASTTAVGSESHVGSGMRDVALTQLPTAVMHMPVQS